MENSKDLKARARTYSQCKSKKTMKHLMGISPQEVISFISKGWGGRTTDAHITANSGFLDNLLPGDLILADRGFTIQNQAGLHCAKVEAPALSRGKKQLGAIELEDSRKLAAVRIHAERVIGQARSKYKILHGPVPISHLMPNAPICAPQ
uniref:DDE Tnp4 domain-containing protein n=1 Tax=Nothobranchius rachovii TaxID=451742 RepID=A0A1A8NJF4_9TELE